MKILVIGSTYAGKTTLASYYHNHNISFRDVDEEITASDVKEKYNDQIPKIIKDALSQKDILLIANTDYLALDDLREAKKNGFKIFQLEISLPEAVRRNQMAVKAGKEDMSLYLEGNFDYQIELKRLGLVDVSLDSLKPIEKLVKEIV